MPKHEGFRVLPPEEHWGSDEDKGLHIVLVEPEIPGNTGNIGRLCAGTNIWLHLTEPLGFELENRYLKRAGLDYWPHVRLCVHPSFESLAERFPRNRLHFLSKKASHPYTEVEFLPGSVLIFGCETKGLSDQILKDYEDRLLRIPTTDKVRSLNLSNACAIVTYEALRQLSFTPLQAK
ncbi:tRNA (cytidine(34)-2'-O)-methyltransferase [Microvenator marinus]|jgi:tRNA (cytidine/uridine-2'-O-)-methyltransferase|uniref:Putative tRNA (cytidine(34)-2'-O)-methyltransferase n=1 Tax=Microvenator marinus TaxID=2600177 RepID=A0A5B8XRR0_9DELT|nr:tRNA (cytidine(34)-2'-O)-methyltransferase [Microvenator marinus]QED26296.1 tRNA (cytidine(34)-2'-O)-methyltransferase [Microvenator marinus]